MGKGPNPSFHWFFILPLLIALFSSPAAGAEAELESSLQAGLEESRTWVGRAREKQRTGAPFLTEIGKLKSLADGIRPVHLLLQERFRLREEKIASSGGGARERHRMMAEGYRKALEEYLIFIDGLSPPAAVSGASLDRLQTLLDQILHKKKLPILGSLPYRNLRHALKDPGNDPPITPAYQGGNKMVSPDDLKTIASQSITVLAQSLSWNPVSIYEWVKNNIDTEWYFGCMKGAEETLSQKGGNDCDQASLLVALLRAAGYPSRYVRGVIEFFPDIAQAKNLTGIGDERELASFLQKAGIPLRTVVAGGKISNIQIEHIWVESQVPYSNYRGAIIDAQGKTWIALDTSIKVVGYETNFPADLPPEPFFPQIRDQYLAAFQAQTPLEMIQSKLEDALSQRQPGKHYSDLLRRRVLLPEVLNILPASLQFRQIKVTQEFTEIPPELLHQVRLIATDSNRHELLNVVLNAAQLSNRKAVLTYEPETVEDQETIDLHGGLDNTPAYLVRLRPVLKVNEERIAVAQDGLPMGSNYTFTVEMTSPNGTERFTTKPIAGNLSALGIVSQKAVLPEAIPDAEKNAERLLYEEALRYIDRWDRAEEEMTSLMRLALSRPVPTLVMVGGVIDVSYLLDTPHGFEWKGVYVDAGLRAVEIGRSATTGDDLRKAFMQLSSLQGSVLEERIFKDDFQVESISTAKLLTLATHDSVPILNLDRTNFEETLSTISFSEEIQTDLRNAVNQGLAVKVPSREITYLDWTGVGFLKEDIETGESGWMLSGGIAGGMSAQAPEVWVNQLLRDTLGAAYAGDSNKDPLSAASIIKIPTTDRQEGTVGNLLDQPLSVLVRDKDGLPVKGASVIFRIIAGGGTVGAAPGATTVTVITARNGMAKASLSLGKKTGDNPNYQKPDPKDLYLTQVGLNLATATVANAALELSIREPFEAYGLPDVPDHLVKVLGEGHTGLVSNPAGTIKVLLADQYENPVSNRTVTFKTLDPSSSIPLPPNTRNIGFYRKDDCANPYPLFGDCPTQASLAIPTQAFGAQVETIVGNTIGTTYTIEVSAAKVAPVTFTLFSAGFRSGPEVYAPAALLLGAIALVNDRGQPVNAAQIGRELKAPLVSEFILLTDDYAMEPYNCVKNGQPAQCYQIKPKGTTTVQKITNGTVKYQVMEGDGLLTPTPAENLQNGKYQARFTAGTNPYRNRIEAIGQGTVTIPEVLYHPVSLLAITTDYEVSALPERTVQAESGETIRFDRDTKNAMRVRTLENIVYTVYSVDLKLVVEPMLVLLNDDGYTTDDLTFSYLILPPEYNAANAQIDLYKTDAGNNEAWQGYISGDRTQTPKDPAGELIEGTASYAKGSQFDIQSRYQAEAVVNRGSDMEVRSGILLNGKVKKTELPLGQIKLLDNTTGEPVIGGVTDGATQLKLRLTVKFDPTSLPAMTWGLADPDILNSMVAAGTFLVADQESVAPPMSFNAARIAEVIYKVPETFVRFNTEKELDDKSRADRSIQVRIIGSTHTVNRDVWSIRLKRPPVMLIHGIWADKGSWNILDPLLKRNNKFRTVRVDYSRRPYSSAGPLSQNYLAVADYIEQAIGEVEKEHFAIKRVDIVAHSMGALITREYCKNSPSNCLERIRKFITLDSPHTGSELTDLLVVYRDDRSHFPNPFSFPFSCQRRVKFFVEGFPSLNIFPHPITLGAIDDLATGTLPDFMQSTTRSGVWRDLPPLSTALITHTIVSLTPQAVEGFDEDVKALWEKVLTPCGFTRQNVFKDQADENDRIVTQRSQRAGLTTESTQIVGADHISVHDLPDVFREVESLLETEPKSELFTRGQLP